MQSFFQRIKLVTKDADLLFSIEETITNSTIAYTFSFKIYKPLKVWTQLLISGCDNQGFAGFTGAKGLIMKAVVSKIDPDYKNNSEIKWNFTKFLVSRDGNVLERFESTVEPEKIEAAISAIL